jgi:hypothetical protein
VIDVATSILRGVDGVRRIATDATDGVGARGKSEKKHDGSTNLYRGGHSRKSLVKNRSPQPVTRLLRADNALNPKRFQPDFSFLNERY